MSIVIVLVGLFVIDRLPIRALPAVEATSVSIRTTYTGASPEVVDTEITETIEGAVAGISGVDTITSQSRRGRADTMIEFTPQTNVDEAVNDVRDAVSRILNRLPDEADPPQISKNDSDSDPIIRLSIFSENMSEEQVTDYAERFISDRLTVIDGVAQIESYGQRRQAIRVWLDRWDMAAREVTVDDIEQALSRNSVELPAGELRSGGREYYVRADARLATPQEFGRIVVRQSDNFPVRLRDVATVAMGVEDDQTAVRTNGTSSVGLAILRQSQANTVAISARVREVLDEMRPELPAGMRIIVTSDDALFVNAAIREVTVTLFIAAVIVVAVIFLFVGSLRATLVPAITIPVTLIGTFFGLYLLGYSINILTLLALVLSIGIVVDDAIVIFENIQKRFQAGEDLLTASIQGSRQMIFAVIATSVTLIAVFLPLSLMEGTVGLLFVEFGIVMAIAVAVSTFIALSLCPMLTSKVLVRRSAQTGYAAAADRAFARVESAYARILTVVLRWRWLALAGGVGIGAMTVLLYQMLPSELTPREDRGVLFVAMTGPQGASFEYSNQEAFATESLLEPLRTEGEARSIMSIVGWRGSPNQGRIIVSLVPWEDRDRTAGEIANALIPTLRQIVGVRAFPNIPAGLGLRGSNAPLRVVVGGYEHDKVEQWADALMVKLEENPNLLDIQSDFEENQPEIDVRVQRLQAEDLGISVDTIGRTLQTMLASRIATTFVDRGREYDVIVQASERDRESPQDLRSIYLRSDRTGELIPLDAVVLLRDRAAAATLRRFDRLPSITVSASLAQDYDLGSAIEYVQETAAETLPSEARIDFSGLSREFLQSSSGVLLTLMLAIAIVYLVLAAQFESFLQPLAIMLTVPLATTGALLTLLLTGTTLNIYSQVGLVLLIGLMAKNGILIVDFANQLVAEGQGRTDAALNAARNRLRPIVMTLLSTMFGAVPLVLATGGGAEARFAIGLIILGGLGLSVLLTLFLAPLLYVIFSPATAAKTGAAEAANPAE